MLAILGLSILLNVIWGSISAGLRAERNAELRGVAVRLAASELARARVAKFVDLEPAEPPAQKVMVNDRPYQVKTVISADPDLPDDLRRIVTTVTWEVGTRRLSYEATLLRSKL
jgi:hypothetical protein